MQWKPWQHFRKHLWQSPNELLDNNLHEKDGQVRTSLYTHLGKTCFLFSITDLFSDLSSCFLLSILHNIPQISYKLCFSPLSFKKHCPRRKDKKDTTLHTLFSPLCCKEKKKKKKKTQTYMLVPDRRYLSSWNQTWPF